MADDEDKQNEMLDDITEKIANSASMVPPPPFHPHQRCLCSTTSRKNEVIVHK